MNKFLLFTNAALTATLMMGWHTAQAQCGYEQFSQEMKVNRYSQCGPPATRNITPDLGTITQGCDLKRLFDLTKKVCPSEALKNIDQRCSETGNTNSSAVIPSCSDINRQEKKSYCLNTDIQIYYANIDFYCRYLSAPTDQPTHAQTMPSPVSLTPERNKPPSKSGLNSPSQQQSIQSSKSQSKSKTLRIYY